MEGCRGGLIMNIQLFCSSSSRTLLTEHLISRGLIVGEQGTVVLVERGQNVPEQGVVIIFSMEDLAHLSLLIDTLAGRRERVPELMGGWRENKETYELISHERILYFEAKGNSVYMVTSDERLSVKFKLYELEYSLRPRGFIRISKSVLVNIANVKEIIPWFSSRYVVRLKNGKELEVSRTYVKDFRIFMEL